MTRSQILPLTSFILLALMGSLSSCGGDEEDCERSFGINIRIEEGQELCLSDGSTLFIDEISSSYCPCNVDCLWEGEANVLMRRIYADGTIENAVAHELLEEENPEWAEISRVISSTDCIPIVTEIFIQIRF